MPMTYRWLWACCQSVLTPWNPSLSIVITSVCLLYPPQSSDASPPCTNVEHPSFDLSTATKLKEVVFNCGGSLRWVNAAIESITSKDLEWVTIASLHILVNYGEWWDLDRLLAQLWTSRSIRPTVSFSRMSKMIGLAPKLLPELTKKGAVDVFERDDRRSE